ncbi:hypothetical protein [Microvirga sp. 2TAF3]|uniref:hypothetical protein n=1 Tax=Microvirga sp. 2TAF3 TaxID=3233014 RepID=UPI003F967634
MITALIRVEHGPEALAVTLSALVPAVAAGLVGDAVILAETQDENVDKVADAAGAVLVVTGEEPWKEGARAARHDWLLCLDDGDIPQEGWIRVLERFVALGAPEGGSGRLRRQREGLLRAGADGLRAILNRRGVRAGDLVHRRVLMENGRVRAPVRLAATIGRDPIFG